MLTHNHLRSLPFELGSARRRARTYSFSGSERSVSNTPTPSDMDETSDMLKTEDELDELDELDKKDGDEVVPMMAESIVGKEIVDDELMATRFEIILSLVNYWLQLPKLFSLFSVNAASVFDWIKKSGRETGSLKN